MKRFLRFVSALIGLAMTVSLTVSMVLPVSAINSETLWLQHTVYEENVVEPEVPNPLPSPVFMKFNNEKDWTGDTMLDRLDKYDFYSGEVGGLFEFVKLADGTTCLKLNYHEYDSWSPYRVMPKFKYSNPVTANHKYVRITYMTTDEFPSTITLYNNGGGGTLTLVHNTGNSKGEWTRSNAVDISVNGSNSRFANGQHASLEYHSTEKSSEIYIKEIAFFASEEQAYSYGDYNDGGPSPTELDFSKMTFDISGTGTTLNGAKYGNNYVNEETGDLDIVYAAETNLRGWNDAGNRTYPMKYMAKIKFKDKSDINHTHRFMRVLYAADNPGGLSGKTDVYLSNDKVDELILVAENIEDTDGEYVLSDTVYIPDDMMGRISGTGNYTGVMHNSLVFNANREGGTYSIRAIYFFPTRDAADSYSYSPSTAEFTINENDISNYQIVICEDAPIKVAEAAKALAFRIKALTGENVPIVTDSASETDYEILVGVSNRELSYSRNTDADSHQSAYCFVDGNTLVISSPQPPATKNIVDYFIDRYLYKKFISDPFSIEFTESLDFDYNYTSLNTYEWETVENVEDPDRYFDRFGTDKEFWTEENGADDWYFENGTYNSDKNGKTLSYLHTYERNVEYSMDIMYTDAENDGDMGLMLRYNSADAYIKAGYDFENEEWHITSRDGADFYITRHASESAKVEPDTWYALTFTVDGTTASLSVDGEEILYTDGLTHLTPGRIAVYANDVAMSADNADIYMLSGEGTVMANVAHTKLETPAYTEGGTVHELNDGTLIYHHQNGYGYISTDNGVTWTEDEPIFPNHGYFNVLRLLPTKGQKYGDLMQIISYSGMVYSATSSDDGKTWTRGENPICHNKYQLNGEDTKAGAGNMNDKLTQSATTGRIFYSQNYEAPATDAINGHVVFCEFYYSDDNGNTWTKSETDSWDISGNEEAQYFGECKILECADGTLRMYNSWNDYGCIVYSESHDNGATWGELQFMEDFPCARSSMQFCRDPYAENDTTYYMVWVNSVYIEGLSLGMPRSRLTLAKSTDGKNWDVLGDIWRWESAYQIGAAFINHVVDPFITVNEDYIIAGSGFSENIGLATDAAVSSWHQSQRQHIYSIKKSTIGAPLPPTEFCGDADCDDSVTLVDLTVFNRYLANWNGYDDATYDFSTFDFNDDGAVNPLDSVLFARHIANWDKYKDLSLIKYIPNASNDKYVISGGMTVNAEGYASELGLPAVYSDDVYYRYDNRVVELATGKKATIYSPIKLRSNRVYRVDQNNVVYVEDELNGTLPNDENQSNSHWLSSNAVTNKVSNRDYAKYGIFDVDGNKIVRYSDYTWFASNNTDAVNAKLNEFKTLLAAVINNAIAGGRTAYTADYSSIPGYSDYSSSFRTSLEALAKPYIEAGKTVSANDIVLEPIPATIHGIELQRVGAFAEFDADGYLTLTLGGNTVITPDDEVTELVLVNQGNLSIWRYSELGETVLDIIRTAPQVGIIGKPGQNNSFGKFFERSLKDGIAVVMVGCTNTDK